MPHYQLQQISIFTTQNLLISFKYTHCICVAKPYNIGTYIYNNNICIAVYISLMIIQHSVLSYHQFTVLSHLLLTNYGEILVYILCQVSIHYLPMKDVLKQFRHLLSQNFIIFFCSFIFKLRQISRTPTICSLRFGFRTCSSIAAATETKMKIGSDITHGRQPDIMYARQEVCFPQEKWQK